MSCCGGNCSCCASSCSCGNNCGGCNMNSAEVGTATVANLMIYTTAPPKRFGNFGVPAGSECGAPNCKCGASCSCDSCGCN